MYIHDNKFHDWANGDASDGGNHHDGLHCFSGNTGRALAVYVYNNKFYGEPGQYMNQAIFLEGGTSSTKCLASGGNAYIFNNVFLLNGSFPAFGGVIGGAGSNSGMYVNNTGIANTPTSGTFCMEAQYGSGFLYENNSCGGTGFLFTDYNATAYAAMDYNAYQNCSGYNCWDGGGADTSNFALYKSIAGFDAHSIANIASSTFFNVDANDVPQTGSPVIGAGANLISLCTGDLTPLCADINGVPRPASGPWDIGAYQYVSGAPPSTTSPSPPKNLKIR